ncbi:Activator of stress genes protein 1 [Fusarium oxysporum f. sp. rapae]|uniref:Activator of stress genes protein 1 n=1 Tax=Fusarium oxysporum f. sp. rapae TaxID=485398 RepID=A0A8J5UFH2_FUSOX|nr:Activator of stress genes protein 1 [Fusarium oxysporum f. sp. rapae]
MSQNQSAKRLAASKGESESTGKKRVRYATRACDACRKRKGRCSGRYPCEHCVGRNQQCVYTLPTNDWRDANPAQLQDDQMRRQLEPHLSQEQQPYNDTIQTASLGSILVNLQQQVESLAAQVRQNNTEKNIPSQSLYTASSQTLVDPDLQMSQSLITPSVVVGAKEARPHSKFYGPTSPDYSFNLAQSKLLNHATSKADKPLPVSIEENQSDDEDVEIDQFGNLNRPTQLQISSLPRQQRLLLFRNILSSREVNSLLIVFQETICEYHPIVDAPSLVKTVEYWYSKQTSSNNCTLSAVDEEDLIVANLAIAVALCVESTLPGSESLRAAETLYLSCRELINAKVVSPMPTIKHIVIVLLVGLLHYYKNMPRYAWRMCGLAGRTFMESGLHNTDVLRHVVKTEADLEEHAVIVSTIQVLDRQWSASTGLPTNFSNWEFDVELRQRLKNPYLMAMTTFTAISDKFSEPIIRGAKGTCCEDNDDFEFMNFQIEQWRKKSVGKFDFGPLQNMEHSNVALPPAWAILLHLRAHAVRGILLRPFFFPNVPSAVSQRSIEPGIELVNCIVDTLTRLNRYTDVYQKQHPPFQHILAAGCALLFLMLAYVQGNRDNVNDALPSNFFDQAKRNFENAYLLSSTYSKSSRAARRLQRRLVGMRDLLVQMGVVRPDEYPTQESQNKQCTGTGMTAQNIQQNGNASVNVPASQETQSMRIPGATEELLDSAFLDLENELPFAINSPASSDSMPWFGSGQLPTSSMDKWPTLSPGSLLWQS